MYAFKKSASAKLLNKFLLWVDNIFILILHVEKFIP